MSMQVEVEHFRQALIVRLKGELDHHTAAAVKNKMEEAILRSNCSYLVLNLEDLQFMDSSGIGVILGRYKLIKSRGGKVMVCGVTPSVYRLLEMSGLFKILEVEDTETQALASLGVVS